MGQRSKFNTYFINRRFLPSLTKECLKSIMASKVLYRLKYAKELYLWKKY